MTVTERMDETCKYKELRHKNCFSLADFTICVLYMCVYLFAAFTQRQPLCVCVE